MYTFEQVGLCCGSLLQADFRGLAEAAGQAGFKSISLWPTLFYNARESGLSLADMRAILADCRKNSSQSTQLRTALAAMAYICTNQGRDEEAKNYIIELAALDMEHGSNDTLLALRYFTEGNNLIAGGDYEAALPLQ